MNEPPAKWPWSIPENADDQWNVRILPSLAPTSKWSHLACGSSLPGPAIWLTLDETAQALAKAVLAGDGTAVMPLVDRILELQQSGAVG